MNSSRWPQLSCQLLHNMKPSYGMLTFSLSCSSLFHPRMQKMLRLDRSPLLLYTPDPGCLFVCMQHLPLNIRSLVVHEARYHDQTTGEPEEIKRRSICRSRVLQTFHEISDVMEPRGGGKATFSGVKNISSP